MKLQRVVEGLRRISFFVVKKHLKLFSLILTVSMILLVVIIVPSLFRQSSIVSSEGLKEYIEEYMSEYRRLVEENMGLLDSGTVEGSSQSGSHNLTFYW